MAIHIQTIGRIFGTVGRAFARYNRYESKLFDAAYSGFPRSVRRGARHGYIAGSVLGSLINQDDEGIGDDGLSTSTRSPKVPASSKYYQTRGRFSTRRNRCRSEQGNYRRRGR